jgi:hypothetical protein
MSESSRPSWILSLPLPISRQLPGALVQDLQAAVDELASWTTTLPRTSKFYANERVVSRRPAVLPADVTQRDLELADTFFDIHSVLVAQCLLKGWRVEQLMESLLLALSRWSITPAALATRALVETAAAWFVESSQVVEAWQELKTRRVTSQKDAIAVRRELYEASTQMVWGTRLHDIVQKYEITQRTNILTLVQKAAKLLGTPALWSDYEVLCDAVHPSWGAGECFWEEAGIAPEIYQTRVLLSRDAIGQVRTGDTKTIRPGSPLSGVVLTNATLALRRLAEDLRRFERFTHDLCLTGRVHTLSDLDYWGIVRPTGTYDLCACASGRKSRFCSHDFARDTT